MGAMHNDFNDSLINRAAGCYVGCHVLLVEDDAAVRGITARILRQLGFQIIEAADGVEAMRIFEASAGVDLLFTDVVMPNMDGSDLAVHLRRKKPSLPVVFMSGYAEVLRGKFEMEVPHASYLEKPFGVHDVGDVIQKVMNHEPEGVTP